jgi:uncharacterized protein (TIGR02117 family)
MIIYKITLYILLLQGVYSAQVQEDSVSIYLVKLGWHTGLVIQPNDVDSTYFPEIRLFRDFKYIDIGWGDIEFYRNPGFDVGLAFKALFYSTPSTLRVEGFNFDIMRYVGHSDVGYEIRVSRREFNMITRFISTTFLINNNNDVEIIEKRYGGYISFFKANGRYTAFNTCNTWVSKAFNSAGYNMSTRIVLAEELFNEIKDYSNAARLK